MPLAPRIRSDGFVFEIGGGFTDDCAESAKERIQVMAQVLIFSLILSCRDAYYFPVQIVPVKAFAGERVRR